MEMAEGGTTPKENGRSTAPPPVSILQVYKRLAALETREDENADLIVQDVQRHLADLHSAPRSEPTPTSSSSSSSSTPVTAPQEGGDAEPSTKDVEEEAKPRDEMLSADAASESEFVHLKVISVNNLSYLLSYGDLEGGFGESVVEEDLEVGVEEVKQEARE